MCLLIAADKPGTLTIAQVKRALQSNPDGFGAAWWDGKSLNISRVIPSEATPERVHALIEKTQEFPRLWHWRYSTHGAVTLENVHPFRIGKNAAWAHNGWSDLLARDQKRSDSRIVAEDLIRRPARQTQEGAQVFWARRTSRHSRPRAETGERLHSYGRHCRRLD